MARESSIVNVRQNIVTTSAQERTLEGYQRRLLAEAAKASPRADYTPTNYTFQGLPVYRDRINQYRLANGMQVFRADLEKR